MNRILKFRNGLKKMQDSARAEVEATRKLREDFSDYTKPKKSKGSFEIQDIFYMFIVGLMIYVFTVIWSPILALFNFTGIAYGSILELILNMFGLIIAGGYLAYMIKKWQSPPV